MPTDDLVRTPFSGNAFDPPCTLSPSKAGDSGQGRPRCPWTGKDSVGQGRIGANERNFLGTGVPLWKLAALVPGGGTHARIRTRCRLAPHHRPEALGQEPQKERRGRGKVADSIQRFGFGAPIIARQADHTIIAGHTRWLAAKKLGKRRADSRSIWSHGGPYWRMQIPKACTVIPKGAALTSQTNRLLRGG